MCFFQRNFSKVELESLTLTQCSHHFRVIIYLAPWRVTFYVIMNCFISYNNNQIKLHLQEYIEVKQESTLLKCDSPTLYSTCRNTLSAIYKGTRESTSKRNSHTHTHTERPHSKIGCNIFLFIDSNKHLKSNYF